MTEQEIRRNTWLIIQEGIRDKESYDAMTDKIYDLFIKQAGYVQLSEVKRLALQAITEEPEFPGDMPDELWRELENNREATDRALKGAVRLTKNNITERFLGICSKQASAG